MTKTRVAIIGAGPSGISLLRAFEAARRAGAEIPEVVCYEKQADYGGLWNYTWRTGLDEFGEPVHGGMYRSLWSNGPKECLEYPDYPFEAHFGRPIPSYAPRAVLLDYLKGCIASSGIAGRIRLRHVARSVSYDHASAKFRVAVANLAEDRPEVEDFDDVVVATGHYSAPNAPGFPGFDGFPGRILHSHDVRDAREFAGQNVLLVGGSLSAEDIGLQCFKYGAASVTISYRTRPMGFAWPSGFEEKPLLTELAGRVAHFRDGTTREVDASSSAPATCIISPSCRRACGCALATASIQAGSTRASSPWRTRGCSILGCRINSTPSPCSTPRRGSRATS